MSIRILAAVAAALTLGSCADPPGTTPPPPRPDARRLDEPRLDENVEQVATLGGTTRAPADEEAEARGLQVDVCARGQVVTATVAGGPLQRAGIVAGDVLVALDGNEIYSQDDIADFLRTSAPARSVTVTVRRDKGNANRADDPNRAGNDEKVAVTLGAEPRTASAPGMAWDHASLAQLPAALARARSEGKPVLIGLSGAET